MIDACLLLLVLCSSRTAIMSINSGMIPELNAKSINGDKYVYSRTLKKLSLPMFCSIVSTILLRLSSRLTGVTRITHVMNSSITKNQDLTSLIPSSPYMFSQIISE